MFRSLLYVSVSNLKIRAQAEEIELIIEAARARNAKLDITGALLCTETRFAQILEGRADAVEALFSSISRDPRHRYLRVVIDEQVPLRRFEGWALAYSGASLVLDRHLKQLLKSPARDAELGHVLVEVMQDWLGKGAPSDMARKRT